MLALVIVSTGSGRQREPRADHIGHVGQHCRSALLPVVLDNKREIADVPGFHRGTDRARRGLGTDLVAPDRLKADRLEDVDLLDDPFDGWLPVNRFKDATRGGGRHDIVGDALNFPFRTRKQRPPPRNEETDSI